MMSRDGLAQDTGGTCANDRKLPSSLPNDVSSGTHWSSSSGNDGSSPSGPPPPPKMPPPSSSSKRRMAAFDDAATEASKSVYTTGTGCTSVASTTNQSNFEFRTAAQEEGDHDNNGGAMHNHAGGITDDALHHFYEAMSLVDADEKEGWTMAQAECSAAVLQHECCPCYFLLACQSNPWDAACRLCSYWKERIDLFGDKAFEAMTLGSDAVAPTGLTADDVKLFETGSILVLPKDRKGKAVIFVDDEKLGPHMLNQPASRLRVLWYMLHACFTSSGGNGHRLVVLYACYTPPNGPSAAAIWQWSAGTVRCSLLLPIVMDSIHLLTLQTKTTLIHAIISATATMLGKYLSSLTQVQHGTAKRGTFSNHFEEEAQAKATLLKKLIALGLSSKGIPEWAGGSFGLQDFRSWTKRRRRFEQKVFWTDEQRMQQRRNVNMVHSRQKRRRRHQELHELQVQATQLRLENERAKCVNRHLERIVDAANREIAQLMPFAQSAAIPTFDWTGEPTAGVDPHHLNVLASLEPDPIAPSAVPSAAQRESVHAGFGLNDAHTASSLHPAFSPQRDIYSSANSTMLSRKLTPLQKHDFDVGRSLSAAGLRNCTYVDPASTASSSVGLGGSLFSVAAPAHDTLADNLCSMLQQQQRAMSHSLCNPPRNDGMLPPDHPNQFWTPAQSLSSHFPGPGEGVTSLLSAHLCTSKNNTRRNHDPDHENDGRVDASTLFDSDWF